MEEPVSLVSNTILATVSVNKVSQEKIARKVIHMSESFLHHIKLFPQRDEHLFFSVPGVRDHLPYVMRMLSVANFQNGGQAKEGNKKSKAILQ